MNDARAYFNAKNKSTAVFVNGSAFYTESVLIR